MCADIAGELEGQTSINDLLLEMGEPPVESLLQSRAPDDAASLFEGLLELPGM